MNEEKVKEILNRSAEEIKVEIIPVVVNAIMDAFEKGFDAGMKAMLNNDKSNNQGNVEKVNKAKDIVKNFKS